MGIEKIAVVVLVVMKATIDVIMADLVLVKAVETATIADLKRRNDQLT